MTYDWNASAAAGQPEKKFAEELPEGRHTVHITRIIHGNQTGPFESKQGEPQFMLVFADDQGREATDWFTCTSKQGWKLANLFQSFDPPMDLGKMTEAGITPEKFADFAFAEEQLRDRKFDMELKVAPGRNGKDYRNVYPIVKRLADITPKPDAVADPKEDKTVAGKDLPF